MLELNKMENQNQSRICTPHESQAMHIYIETLKTQLYSQYQLTQDGEYKASSLVIDENYPEKARINIQDEINMLEQLRKKKSAYEIGRVKLLEAAQQLKTDIQKALEIFQEKM